MPVGAISTSPVREIRSSSPGWTAAFTAARSAVTVKTTRSCSVMMLATRKRPSGRALMTAFRSASLRMSAFGCGAIRATVVPTSSKNVEGPRTTLPITAAKIPTARSTANMPITNWSAHSGRNVPARFTSAQASKGVHICEDAAMDALKIVCVGGGLGAPTVMAGLRAYTSDITGLIAVTDSGRSTGKVRIALDVPAPGDIRNALTVLAEGEPVLARLFNHRFETDKSEDLNGMAFGNLFLAALTQQEGSFLVAVEEASRLLKLRGRVLPVTLYNTHLCAELTDGTVVETEVSVRAIGKAPIDRVFLKDAHVAATPASVEAIASADLITLGPGSLYTTVCACLLVPDIARAIANADGLVVYVANTTRQPGQTDGFGVADHVRVVRDYLGGSGLDVAFTTADPPPDHLRADLREAEPPDTAVVRRRDDRAGRSLRVSLTAGGRPRPA